LKLRPVGDQKQNGQSADLIDDAVEEIARGSIAPMRILEYDKHRLLPGQPSSWRSNKRNVSSFLRWGAASSAG
jgi:hypothetical protein